MLSLTFELVEFVQLNLDRPTCSVRLRRSDGTCDDKRPLFDRSNLNKLKVALSVVELYPFESYEIAI